MRISLRDLLFVITIIAIGLGWLVDHQRLKDVNAQLNAENAELVARVLPSSGFAIPSGIATRTDYSNASPEDRKALLLELDQSLTVPVGQNSEQQAAKKETP